MTMRITGLASGIDIDSIVSDLMKAQRIPLNKMQQEKTLLEWKRDAYREMNTLLLGFDDLMLKMRLTTPYRNRSVTSTNENLVSATAANGAGQGSYTISKVTRLATAATTLSKNGISKSKEEKVNLTDSLYSLKENDKLAGQFEWKTGAVQSKSFTAKKEKTFSLDIPTGQQLMVDQDNAGMPEISVKVNGKAYTVVTDINDLEAGKVFVDAVNGTIQFSANDANVKENSTIKVDYVLDKRVDYRTISKESGKISIKGALVKNEVFLQLDDVKDANNNPVALKDDGTGKLKLVIVKDNEEEIELGKEYGTVDYETGTISFNEDFYKDYFPEENEGSEEDSEDEFKLNLTITSKQNYISFGMSTYTSEGRKDETFILSASSSLNEVISRVNSSSLGLMMFYDEHTDRLSLTRTETGKFNPNVIVDPISNQEKRGPDIIINHPFLTDVLGFDALRENDPSYNEEYYTDSQNAEFTINGLTTERSSNTFTMNGVTFTLKRTFGPDEAVTLNVKNDEEQIFNNIVDFINKYNELVEKIESKLKETKYKSYAPLTDDERESLSEKQQEQWEEKARSGLLRNDTILSNMITSMRSAISSLVNQSGLNPAMKSLSSIGITTTSNYSSAKLVIDEDKLKEAIAKDPESVELLFRGTGETTSEKGVVHRLTDIVKYGMNQLKERAGTASLTYNQYTIGRQLNMLEKRIEAFEDRLVKLEDRYYRQFSSMESAIQRANSQMAYLSQYFS